MIYKIDEKIEAEAGAKASYTSFKDHYMKHINIGNYLSTIGKIY